MPKDNQYTHKRQSPKKKYLETLCSAAEFVEKNPASQRLNPYHPPAATHQPHYKRRLHIAPANELYSLEKEIHFIKNGPNTETIFIANCPRDKFEATRKLLLFLTQGCHIKDEQGKEHSLNVKFKRPGTGVLSFLFTGQNRDSYNSTSILQEAILPLLNQIAEDLSHGRLNNVLQMKDSTPTKRSTKSPIPSLPSDVIQHIKKYTTRFDELMDEGGYRCSSAHNERHPRQKLTVAHKEKLSPLHSPAPNKT